LSEVDVVQLLLTMSVCSYESSAYKLTVFTVLDKSNTNYPHYASININLSTNQ